MGFAELFDTLDKVVEWEAGGFFDFATDMLIGGSGSEEENDAVNSSGEFAGDFKDFVN